MNTRRELLIFVYKYRLRLAVAFLIPFVIFTALSFIPSPRYRAESVLIVRLGSEYVYQPETGNNQNSANPTIPFDREQIAKSEVAILESEDLHRKTLESIGADILYPGQTLAKAVTSFNKRFDILLKRESAVIELSYEHKDASLATQVLENLLKFYFEKRKQLYLEPRMELAEAQMRATRSHALEAEQALADFKRAHKIYSLSDERAELLHQRADVQKELTVVYNAGLKRKLQYYNEKLDGLDALEREYDRLVKEAKIADDSYSLYSHRRDEAKAYEDVQRERIGSVRIIQPPITQAEPKKLQPLILLGGFFFSLLCMVGVAAVTEFAKRGYLTPEQIERHLSLPVLAVIPLREEDLDKLQDSGLHEVKWRNP